MKNKKLMQGFVNKLLKLSFKDERLLESQVVKSIKVLKSLPKSEAIQSLQEYLQGIKRIERDHTLIIEAATPLSSLQVSKAKKFVEKTIRISKIQVTLNPEILGGFKLKVGDNIWDSSVLGSIYQIKEAVTYGGSGN